MEKKVHEQGTSEIFAQNKLENILGNGSGTVQNEIPMHLRR
ncbi:hypothetical protein [Peribacillus simplex]|nr:hypothetical protein [Peribacillus simplex]